VYIWPGPGYLRLQVPYEGPQVLTAADLDRLISRYGADWNGSQPDPGNNFRPKETAEVAPATLQNGGELHGGDGSSGECDQAASTPQQYNDSTGDSPPAAQDGSAEPAETADSAQEKEGAGTSEVESIAEASRGPSTGCEGESPDGEPTGQGGPLDSAGDAVRGDDPAREEPAVASAANEPAAEEKGVFSESDGGHVTSDAALSPRNRYGGTFADEEAAYLLRRSHTRPAKEIVRAFRRLIQSVDLGGLEESPRISAPRLAKEIVSSRYHLARAVRRELDIPLIAMLCDVSGSCSAVCTDTLAACLAVADELPNCTVLRHSNGILVGRAQTILDHLAELHRAVGLVVAFGDWDAGDQYRTLCESGAQLVWLDSYAAKGSGVRKASKRLRAAADQWKRQPLAWYQGVNDASSAAIALRAAARGT
jgi:hypothetical protein